MRKIIAYKNAKLRHREGLYDIVTEGEKIIGIAKDSAGKYSDAEIVDLGGRLVCEPYVESHIHLDYVYTADIPAEETASGTLFEAIEKWSGSKHQLSKEDIKKRAYKGILTEMRNGVQYIRTHVDVTDPEFTAFQAMLEVKEEVKDKVDIQLIAFPQEGMYAYRDGDKLVEQALKMGADVVGGIPHYEFTREDGVKSVKKAIELACRYDKLVDIHCDETDDDQSRFVEMIAAEAYFSGLKDRVTASHTCAMGSYNNAYAFKLMSKLAQSGINCISCPTENTYLQGRYDNYPKRRGLTRIDELTAAGVNVSLGQDSISDPWYPLGNGNLMNQLDFAIHISHLMSVEQIWNALDYITVNGAKTLHLSDYGIREGSSASFIVIDAPNEFEAVRERAGIIRSVRKGRTIFEKKPAVIMTDIF
ncbi:MAG: cytosine deaminase [Lachnospiraceae bacterium]